VSEYNREESVDFVLFIGGIWKREGSVYFIGRVLCCDS
jgi:hypothetical protein